MTALPVLEPLDEIMCRVLEHLRGRNPYIDPVPKHLLPKGATMVKSSPAKSNRGLVYSVPYHTDYKRRIVDYGKYTGAKFILKPSRRLGMKEEYCCHPEGARGNRSLDPAYRDYWSYEASGRLHSYNPPFVCRRHPRYNRRLHPGYHAYQGCPVTLP